MFERILVALGVLVGILFGAALLISVIKASPTVLAGLTLLAVQVLLVIAFLIVVAALLLWLSDEISNKYAPQVKAVKRHSPALLASAALISEGVKILAEHGFGDEKQHAAEIVGIVLLIGFWVADRLLESPHRVRKILGWVLWVLTVLFFPYAIIVYRGITAQQFFAELFAMDAGAKLLWVVAFLALLIIPAATLADDAAHGGQEAA